MRDIASNEKIFLFKATNDGIPDDSVMEIHAALREIGPDSRLFYVQVETADHPAHSVWLRAPNLVYGFLDKAAIETHMRAEKAWLALCRAAYALFASQPQAPVIESP